jgi:hypothetical protein
MQALSPNQLRHGRTVIVALVGMVVALAVALGPNFAGAAPVAAEATKACPGFRVIHNDRIGTAVFPAGTYTVNLEDASLNCKSSAELFARFLEDWDGDLPKPWEVRTDEEGGPGSAFFLRGPRGGFSVELTAKAPKEGSGTNPDLGALCPGTFTVNSTTTIGSLRFTKGAFLIYLPQGTAISCGQASALFQRFLGAGGSLPSPWKLTNQTATFFKPSNPTRTAFRIESPNGSVRR